MLFSHKMFFLAITFCLVWTGGCKKKHGNYAKQKSDPAQVAAYRDHVAKGKKSLTFDQLTQKHVGKACVVTAATPTEPSPPPPPRGMVRVFGDLSVYTANLESLDSEQLVLSAAYPSGKLKTVEILTDEIEFIAVAP